jgi:putative ABC transport system permease protein
MSNLSRTYRFWLRVLPSSFRDEFADEMATVFVDQRRRTHGMAVMGLWLNTIAALLGLSVRLRLDQLRLDLRDATRSLIRNKTFTVTAIATLALALGPATAVFSVINGVILDPIPGVSVERLVYVWTTNADRTRFELPWSELNFLDQHDRQRGFAATAAFAETSATFGGDAPEQVAGALVSLDMFQTLGVGVVRGRRLEAADHELSAEPVIVLAEAFAQQRFGQRDPIGQRLRVDGRDTAVIGVLPARLRFPSARTNFWLPLRIDRATSSRGSSYLSMIGRLAPGTRDADALGAMNQVAADLEREFPRLSGYTVEFAPATDQLTRDARRVVRVLGLAALAILLLAATNIASLLVVRTAGRQTELAVRTALGASGSRLTRQFLAEHLLLSFVAAASGIAVAAGLIRVIALTGLIPAGQLRQATLGWPSLAFLVGLAALTATGIGWAVSRRAARASLAATTRTESATTEVVRLRQLLVGVEVGAALVLLAAAALLLQSAARLLAVDHGFQAENLIKFQVVMPAPVYNDPAIRVRFIDEVVSRLQRMPGVQSAGSAGFAPMGSVRATRRFAIVGQPSPAPGAEPTAIDLPAGPSYAETVGLRLVDGRWIDPRDRIETPAVIVVSESFARKHFPGERAVGKRVQFYNGRTGAPAPPDVEIVGVVADVRQFAVAQAPGAQMYAAQAQRPWGFTSFFVRTTGDPRSVIGGLAGVVQGVDPERPVEQLQTFADLVADSTADRRALSTLLAAAALVALLISALGVYGVAAATTTARRRELAIRAAIGADRSQLLRLAVRQALIAAAFGIIAGSVAGLAASSVLDATLYEVQSRDPLTFAAVGLVLFAVCWIASYVPARRAVLASPAEALRSE